MSTPEPTPTPDPHAEREVAGFAVKADPMPLRHYTESVTYPGIVWPA
jgi:hypothetical protein